MPTIDELSPREVREKRFDVQVDPEDEPPQAHRPTTILVSYDRALPMGVKLPLVFEVQGPSASSYQHREFLKHPPKTVIFTPKEGGRHLVVIREAGHNRWFGSVAIQVAGEPMDPRRPRG